MRPGRELDCAIAEKVFGHHVAVKKRILFEETPLGDRPLRFYSKEIEWAWQVAEKMKISLLPIEGNSWFAFVGAPESGWKSPADFLRCMQEQNFVNSGAAVGENAALVICQAAISAILNREKEVSPSEEMAPKDAMIN